jgi:hypothetical protein
MRKRNPMARDLRVNPLYRPRKGKSHRGFEQRADRWSCSAKHKMAKSPGSQPRVRAISFSGPIYEQLRAYCLVLRSATKNDKIDLGRATISGIRCRGITTQRLNGAWATGRRSFLAPAAQTKRRPPASPVGHST